jgi:hypothetical protein
VQLVPARRAEVKKAPKELQRPAKPADPTEPKRGREEVTRPAKPVAPARPAKPAVPVEPPEPSNKDFRQDVCLQDLLGDLEGKELVQDPWEGRVLGAGLYKKRSKRSRVWDFLPYGTLDRAQREDLYEQVAQVCTEIEQKADSHTDKMRLHAQFRALRAKLAQEQAGVDSMPDVKKKDHPAEKQDRSPPREEIPTPGEENEEFSFMDKLRAKRAMLGLSRLRGKKPPKPEDVQDTQEGTTLIE